LRKETTKESGKKLRALLTLGNWSENQGSGKKQNRGFGFWFSGSDSGFGFQVSILVLEWAVILLVVLDSKLSLVARALQHFSVLEPI